MDDRTQVTLPYGRLVEIATVLGSQSVDWCPGDEHLCFRHTGRDPYIDGPIADIECRECIMAWLFGMTN